MRSITAPVRNIDAGYSRDVFCKEGADYRARQNRYFLLWFCNKILDFVIRDRNKKTLDDIEARKKILKAVYTELSTAIFNAQISDDGQGIRSMSLTTWIQNREFRIEIVEVSINSEKVPSKDLVITVINDDLNNDGLKKPLQSALRGTDLDSFRAAFLDT